MTTWDDIVSAISNFWNWLTSSAGNVVKGFSDTLGELGAWIFGGLKWLADQFYNAISWLADKIYGAWTWFADRIHDAYNYLAQWIGGGLQWISSGLSWIGQHLYSLGQWLWNGILWVCHTIVNIAESIANWIWQQLMNIYNYIVGMIVNWIKGINDYLNDWFKSLRQKLMLMVTANFTFSGFEKALNLFSKGKFKHGIGMLIASPIVGVMVGYLVDAIVPVPQSQRIIFFPEFDMSEITPEPVNIPKPPIPTEPTESPITQIPTKPPALGYRPNVEAEIGEALSYNVEVLKTQIPVLVESEGIDYSVEVGKLITVDITEGESIEGGIHSGAYLDSTVEESDTIKVIAKAFSPEYATAELSDSIQVSVTTGMQSSILAEEDEAEEYTTSVQAPPVPPVSAEVGETEEYETVTADFPALYIKTYTFEITNFIKFIEGKYAEIEINGWKPVELYYQKGYAFEITYNIENAFNLVATYDFESGTIP